MITYIKMIISWNDIIINRSVWGKLEHIHVLNGNSQSTKDTGVGLFSSLYLLQIVEHVYAFLKKDEC